MRKALFIATISTAGFLFGCSESSPPVNSVEAAQSEAHPTVIQDKRILTDSAISGIAEILGVNESYVGDLKKIQVRVFNGTKVESEFFYKFEWFDTDGNVVESPMSIWKQQTIEPNEEIPLVAVAPKPNAVDFRLKLQTNVE